MSLLPGTAREAPPGQLQPDIRETIVTLRLSGGRAKEVGEVAVRRAVAPRHARRLTGTLPRGWTAMTISPIGRFTYLAFELNAMLDAGHRESIEKTRRHVDDGTIFEWLDSQLRGAEDLDGTPVDPDVRGAILKVFRPLNEVDSRHEFGVEHNGIALLLAYCLEGIQQQEPLIVRPGDR
jgi:hypothetical protein